MYWLNWVLLLHDFEWLLSFFLLLPILSGWHFKFKFSYKCNRTRKFINACDLPHTRKFAHEKDWYDSNLFLKGYGLGYSPYNMYNRPYGYGSNTITPSTFARRAEESCQPAFNSVQSVVQAFASVATMLDSTFFAVHSSFRAVLGVADQLSSLKTHISNTIGAFAVFKAIRYVFRRIMSWLRLGNFNGAFSESEAWNDATRDVAERRGGKATKSWPVVLFFAVVLGTPWLIWKLLQTLSGDEYAEDWMMGKYRNHFHFVVCIFGTALNRRLSKHPLYMLLNIDFDVFIFILF